MSLYERVFETLIGNHFPTNRIKGDPLNLGHLIGNTEIEIREGFC